MLFNVECVLLQLNHGFYGPFYRSHPINSMTVVKVDRVDTESLKAPIAGLLDIFRVRAKGECPVGLSLKPALGGDKDIAALARSLHPLANEILAVAVDIRQIPEP